MISATLLRHYWIYFIFSSGLLTLSSCKNTETPYPSDNFVSLEIGFAGSKLNEKPVNPEKDASNTSKAMEQPGQAAQQEIEFAPGIIAKATLIPDDTMPSSEEIQAVAEGTKFYILVYDKQGELFKETSFTYDSQHPHGYITLAAERDYKVVILSASEFGDSKQIQQKDKLSGLVYENLKGNFLYSIQDIRTKKDEKAELNDLILTRALNQSEISMEINVHGGKMQQMSLPTMEVMTEKEKEPLAFKMAENMLNRDYGFFRFYPEVDFLEMASSDLTLSDEPLSKLTSEPMPIYLSEPQEVSFFAFYVTIAGQHQQKFISNKLKIDPGKNYTYKLDFYVR